MCVHSVSPIQVSGIVNLYLSQDAEGTFPEYNYQAINNGASENIALVALSAPVKTEAGFEVVRVQVVLAASFFASPEPAPIDASGTVSLDVAGLTSGRKHRLLIDFESLLHSDSDKNEKEAGRLLQANDAANPFSLSAELSGNDSAGDISSTPIAFSTIIGGAVLGGMALA